MYSDILSGILTDMLFHMSPGILSSTSSYIHSDNAFWHVFGSVCAQTDLELATEFGSGVPGLTWSSPRASGAKLHKITTLESLELALAVRSRSIGAHSDDKLAEGGSEEE